MGRNKITLEKNNSCGRSHFWSDAGSPVLGSGEQNCLFAATVCVSVYLSVCLYCYNCVLWGVLRGVTQADTIWWTTPHELFSYLSFENSWRASAKFPSKYNHLWGEIQSLYRKKYKQVVAGRGAGERRHLPRFHLCGFVPHTHHNTLPPRCHHRHCHCHRHSLTSRQCFLHHHWHYYCHMYICNKFWKGQQHGHEKTSRLFCVLAAVSLWSPLFKMFDLKFQNHTWCRPLSPFAGGAKLSNCKKIFSRPPAVVVQHDHHRRQCHTCHNKVPLPHTEERLQMGSGCTFLSFCFCCIFCFTFGAYFALHTTQFFK